MKKILVFLFALAMLFCLAACSGTEEIKGPTTNGQDIVEDTSSSVKSDDSTDNEKTNEEDKKYEGDKPSGEEMGSDTVYVTPSGSKYHLSSGCAGKSAIATTYGEVKDTHQPCKTCVKEIPIEPEQPTDPGELEEPTTPAIPEKPTTPVKPEQPDDPTIPTEPEQPNEPITSDESSTSATVYITPTGKKYHYKASCAGKNAIERILDQVKNTHTPCKTCAKKDIE